MLRTNSPALVNLGMRSTVDTALEIYHSLTYAPPSLCLCYFGNGCISGFCQLPSITASPGT